MIVAKATPEQFDQVKEWLRSHEGLDLGAGNSGAVQKAGIRAQFAFDGQQLQIEVTHTPFPVPVSVVEGRVMDGLRIQGLQPSKQG